MPPWIRSRDQLRSWSDDYMKKGCRGLRACPRHGAT
nr:MAG TPA: hypothetical protein [Bacteriophage sp.]